MALYDTRFGLPQSVADYLNQGLPDIYQNIYNPPPATIGPITTMPVESKPLVDSLYPQTGGNEEGFSVYNPDPNMTRTSKNYNPRPAYEAAFGTMMGDPVANIATGALNKFDVMGPYQEKPPSGLETLFNKYIKSNLPIQLLSKLGDKLPVNRAGILQNELLGGGFMLDNIGRIVSAPGKYNTPEGIMAGYNPVSGGLLNMLTGGKKGEPATYGLDKSYDKRRETISKTLKEKYGMTDEEIAAAVAGEYEGDIKTDLIGRLDLLNKSQNLFNKRKKAADVIFDRKIEERKQEALEKQRQEQMAREADTAARARAANASVYASADRQGFTNDRGGFSTSAADRAGTSAGSGQFSPSTSRGRSGY
jgi:hypothetical protein